MRKLIVSALALMAAHALVSCKKKDTPPATPPGATTGATGPVAPTGGGAAPVAMVPLASPAVAGDVLGSGAIGSIDELVTAIEPYLAAMGSSKLGGAAIKAQIGKWIGLETWEGIDGAKPMRVWLVNPKKFKPPFVVALPLVAGKKAAVKGWAMEEIAGHAVLARDAATIAAVKSMVTEQLGAPAAATGSKVAFGLAVPALLEVYAPEIERLLGKLSRMVGGASGAAGGDTKKFLAWLGRGALDVARQIARADIQVVADKDSARLQLRLTPLPGTSLAQFLAAPKQAMPTSLSKVAGDVSVAAVVAYAPDAVKTLFDKIAAHMESMGAEKPGQFAAFFRDGIGALMSALKGDFVYVKRTTGNATTALMSVIDGPKGLEALRSFYVKAGALMQSDQSDVKSNLDLKKEAGAHKGTKFDRMRVTYDYSKLPEMHRKLLEQIQGKAMDSFLALKDGHLMLAGSNQTVDKPIQDALDTLSAPAAGQTLADKAEFKALLSQLPPSRFAVLYVSFVDYLKGALAGLAGMGGAGKLDALKSEGFLGASLASEGGALQVDAVATRSQIESIRTLFGQMRGMGMGGPPPAP